MKFYNCQILLNINYNLALILILLYNSNFIKYNLSIPNNNIKKLKMNELIFKIKNNMFKLP